eukprot:11433444-Alexandrium_andersonii.AAC.1
MACRLSHNTLSTSGGDVTQRPSDARTPVTGSVFLNLLRPDSQYRPGRGGRESKGRGREGESPG